MNKKARAGSPRVPVETIYSLGADTQRRALIRVLARHDRELTLNDVTKEIVTRQIDGDIMDVPGETVVRVANALYHNHIPRLADAGIVRFNPARKLVEPTEKLDAVATHLGFLAAE